jgi:ABC-type dipeptide/oligopeptide/nickel transport system permease component
VRRRLLIGTASIVLSVLLLVWLTDASVHAAPLSDLTLGLLLVGREPFRGLSLSEALLTAVSRSAILLAAALGVAIVIGLLAGVAYAFSGRRPIRAAAWTVGTVGASLPSFFWALLLQLVVIFVFLRTQKLIAPVSGGFGLDAHIVLPAMALAMRPAAYIFRTTATALDEAQHAPHVVTALAKGLGPMLVATRHVARNSAPAILAGLALGAKTTLSSLAIVEYMFTWNGAGYGFILALAKGDVAFATLIAIVFALAMALLGVAIAAASRAITVTAR